LIAVSKEKIIVRGARQNNLKNINVEIPRDKLVVVTGLSGSGKSSLAIDTVYAEGQRRYMESVSTYARQFLGSMDKPDVDSIDGLSPAIAIEQRQMSQNPRSTVGTVTEIYDYLRLLFANIGILHCIQCGREIHPQSTSEMTDQIISKLPVGTKFRVLSPVVYNRKGEYQKLFKTLQKEGYARVMVDGTEYQLDEEIPLEKQKKHSIDVVIDRLVMKDVNNNPDFRISLANSIEQASKLAEGLVKIEIVNGETLLFSEHFACPECQISYPKIKPTTFSFNTPQGSCPKCNGLGTMLQFTEKGLFPNKELTMYESELAQIGGFRSIDGYSWKMINTIVEALGSTLDQPMQDIPQDVWNAILYGTDQKIEFNFVGEDDDGNKRQYTFTRNFEGIINILQRRYLETKNDEMRAYYQQFMDELLCEACHGDRLRPEALAVSIQDKNIIDVTKLDVDAGLKWINDLEKTLTATQKQITKDVIKEIRSRYEFLKNVGLDYLTLDRKAGTLSGGESERVRLATQIGSNLVGVLYVLDEPSIGLHSRDKFKLINMLKTLRDKGNSVLIVEHDEDIMRESDWIIDMGPGAGIYGGQVVAEGTMQSFIENPKSLTGEYLSGKKQIEVPQTRRKVGNGWIRLKGCAEHNLKNIDVNVPLGVLTVFTGVSGAGKSSLVMEILYKKIHNLIYRDSREKPGKVQSVEIDTDFRGISKIDKIIHIDQKPIGTTPRSIPATYTKIFDYIRDLFAENPEANMRGYTKGRFSFNVKGGRCEKCGGSGYILVQMQFLPDVYVKCEECKGARYNRETLEVKFKGKNIAEILDMSHVEALEFFDKIPKIKSVLQTIVDVGLGYLKLGQSSTTLSGGEAQRIKLSRELSKRATGKTLYILDEPTTGLHFEDVRKLLGVIQRLVDQGNTVLIIEHNMDVIKCADYIIDIGPEGGNEGGYLVAAGTPEEIAKCKNSYTAQYLAPLLGMDPPGIDINMRYGTQIMNEIDQMKNGNNGSNGNNHKNATKKQNISQNEKPSQNEKATNANPVEMNEEDELLLQLEEQDAEIEKEIEKKEAKKAKKSSKKSSKK
jgi:excinuclease ABC subunit A